MRPDEHGGELAGPDVRLDFSVNLNPAGMPPAVKDAIVARVNELSGYPDPHCRELRQALARYHGIDPEHIICGNGATDLIYRACAAIRPRLVLTAAPTFTEYERSARACGAAVSQHRLDAASGFALDSGFLEAITPAVELVFCCQPNNPTGRLIAAELLDRLVARTRAVGATLVVDECFLPFTEAPTLIPRAVTQSHVVVLRALTKTHALAGLRLGYAIADPALCAVMSAAGPRWNVSSIAQLAGLAALSDGDWDACTRLVVAEERDWVSGALTKLGLSVLPSAANFILFQARIDLLQPLLDRGIAIRSCANFPGLDATWWRIGLKTRAENQLLIDALTEVLNG
jgi:threonine-phosphate decarboxylase